MGWVVLALRILEVFFPPLSNLHFVCQQLAGMVPYNDNYLRWLTAQPPSFARALQHPLRLGLYCWPIPHMASPYKAL